VALTAPSKPKVAVRPITPPDFRAVAEFMHAELNQQVPAAAWLRAIAVPWPVEQPNAGFMLLADGEVVGANLAFYSERTIDGRRERFCNLGAWCVREEHRFHALRLVKSLLAQDGYHFTDLSPSGSVVGLNERLGFAFLDTTTALAPNLPLPSRPRRGRIRSDPAAIERTLDAGELAIYRDHAATAAARHLVLTRGDEHCYVIFRKDRRKGVPLFASLLYVSNPELLRRMAVPLTRHLLLRHGAAATLVERAVTDRPPRLSFAVRSPRRKMFRSPTLTAAQIDFLYSELVCLSW
jgi:hypothetical protein